MNTAKLILGTVIGNVLVIGYLLAKNVIEERRANDQYRNWNNRIKNLD